MLWQSAYAEMVFLDTLWPDFDRKELWRAIEIYRDVGSAVRRRDRRSEPVGVEALGASIYERAPRRRPSFCSASRQALRGRLRGRGPGLRFCAVRGTAAPQMPGVGDREGEGVRGVRGLRRRREPQQSGHHRGHLRLVRAAVTGDLGLHLIGGRARVGCPAARPGT